MMTVGTLEALMTTGNFEIPSFISVTEEEPRKATHKYIIIFYTIFEMKLKKLQYFLNLTKLISFISISVLVGLKWRVKITCVI